MKIAWDGGEVSAAWNDVASPQAIVVLAHGAGGDMSDRVLVGLSKALEADEIATLRFNFPYREAGRRTPGSQRDAEACYRSIADFARRLDVPLYLGGKSYGGRIATHIVADGYEVDGLVLLSYPLHPPGRFDKLRDEHLARIAAPMLFVQGTRDTFARPDLLEKTRAALPNATHVPIENGDHGLKARGRKPDEVVADIVSAFRTFTTNGRRPAR